MKAIVQKNDLLYPELSYKIVGCAFDVYRKLGPGHLERIYQKALAQAFTKAGLKFVEQARHEVAIEGKSLGKGFFDFLVEDKVVVELKRGRFNSDEEIHQTLGYLTMSNLELAIIIRFTTEGAKYKRVVNISSAA
jgi:GxxExxY protein